jgi:hypothetical protein
MVTPNSCTQVKVWADPYLDKPDIFNSYPHWPVTRGIPTTWLDDPAMFANPTHSNLVNLVNSPVEQTDSRKDFLWLIGMDHGAYPAEAADAQLSGNCWLQPGEVRGVSGAAYEGYSQRERAYVLTADADAAECRFEMLPADGTAVRNPAFIIEGWDDGAAVAIDGAESIATGREGDNLVIFAKGTFTEPTSVEVLRPGCYVARAVHDATQ